MEAMLRKKIIKYGLIGFYCASCFYVGLRGVKEGVREGVYRALQPYQQHIEYISRDLKNIEKKIEILEKKTNILSDMKQKGLYEPRSAEEK